MKLILPFFIFSIFLFINKAAFAEWSLYGETDAGYHFINLDDTSSDDKYVYYWILTDYKEPQSNNIISDKFLSKKVYNKLTVEGLELVHLKLLFIVKKCLRAKLL